MSQETKSSQSTQTAKLRINNIGGISSANISFSRGVTILEGRNATNRTSLLQAIATAFGSDMVSLKGDTEQGDVELILNEEKYERTLRRDGENVTLEGAPYLEDPTVADLFAFLLESNEARRAVARSDDLREIIMRPIDTEEIKTEIERLESERQEIDDQLEKLDELKSELPTLEERKQELESEIEAKHEQLETTEDKLESLDSNAQEAKEEKDELETRLNDLRNLRSQLEDVRSDIELQEESIASLRSERTELREEQAELPDTPMGDYEQLNDEITRLRERKQDLESTVSNLQNVIQFNEEMLEGEQTAASGALGANRDDRDSVTDQLLEDESIICWTCGSDVQRDSIEATVEEMRTVRKDRLNEIQEIESELEERRKSKREREQQQKRREKIERELADVEEEIDNRESRVDDLRARRDELSQKIETVEEEVDELESEDFSDVLDLHKEANQLEFELGRLESKLDDVTDRLNTIEDRLAEEESLQERRDEIQTDLEAERTRIDRIESQAIEQFNDRMDDLLELLDYENLSRIWIERVQKTVREGRRKVEKTVFELHVVRTAESGATYEDTVDHLSESEREVTGLTFALAGYLVHGVHEQVPFMLLDSLEAIDAQRLADIVDYFSDATEYLIVALLPEDAKALPDEYTRVTEI